MSPNASKELRTVLWIFVASFSRTPALLWLVGTALAKQDPPSREDFFDIYRAMFSLGMDLVFVWLIILVPVIFYEIAITCWYYWKHPEQLRTVFQFSQARRRGKPGHPDDRGGMGQ